MSAVPCVLGFDPSKTKLGWGAVRDADGSPVRCGYQPHGGSPEAVHDAIADIAVGLAYDGYEPTFALIEYPFGGGSTGGNSIFESGVAVGMVELSARLRWGIPLDRIGASHWRPRVGVPSPPAELRGKSNATARRDWLKAADVDLARELGFDLPIVGARKRRPSDDAADGALIARAAWLALESEAPGSPQRTTERSAA